MDRQSATISGLKGVMRNDEALLLKCYDSARDGRAVRSPHGAFEDPTAPPDVLSRECIELRTNAFHSA